MIIEHQESKKLIEDTFRDYGKVSKYTIKIDKEQLHSAWTPVKEEAGAFQVFDEAGKENFLYYDELDNYYRMMLVQSEAVTEKNHLSDIVKDIDLPEVGHIYQREREKEALSKELTERYVVKRTAAVEQATAHFEKMWDERFAINIAFGNVYDMDEGRDQFAASMTQQILGDNGMYFDDSKKVDAMPMTTLLKEFEERSGHPFVASLDSEASTKQRLSSLEDQLKKGIFLEKHGFIPSVKEHETFDSETEAMLTFTLSDAKGDPIVDINVLFPESEEYYECVSDPLVVSINDHTTGELLEYEVEVDEHPILDDFMGYIADQYDDTEWVISDEKPTLINKAKPNDEAMVTFESFKHAASESTMLRCMDKHERIGDVVADMAARMDKKLEESVSFSP